MRLRPFFVGLIIGAVTAMVPACGTTTRKCLRSNCAGCCDANDECQSGAQPFACGVDGRTCTTCAMGQGCQAGLCTGTATTGGGAAGGGGGGTNGGTGGNAGGGASSLCSNCNGCCDNGICRGGNTATLCGRGGATCENCQSQNKACNTAGACITFSCPGCLLDGGVCSPGMSNLACGTGAAACRQCATNESCVNGSCSTVAATCGPANCGGCCNGLTCVQTPTNAACGSGGSMCVTCSGAEQCTGGQCQAPTAGGSAGGIPSVGGGLPVGGGLALPCSALTCTSGCCDMAGVCQPGDANNACGFGGRTCRDCSNACLFKNCL